MFKKSVAIFLSLVLLFSFSQISYSEENQREVVLTSFYPVYIFTQNVLKDIDTIEVVSMTESHTGCLHDYQLVTKDMKALSKAKAFVVNGASMEGFLPDIVAQFKDLPIVDLSINVPLIEDEMHGVNPHIWLAPQNAISIVQTLENQMIQIFPQHKEKIAQNATNYIQILNTLNDDMRATLQEMSVKNVASFHEAFEYLFQSFDINVVASAVYDDHQAPSPKQILTLIGAIKDNNQCPMFYQKGHEMPVLNTIEEETGATLFALDTITSGDKIITDYEDRMRDNLKVLHDALK